MGRKAGPASTITFAAATSAEWADVFFLANEYLQAEAKIRGDENVLDLHKEARIRELYAPLDLRTKAVVRLARHLGGVPVAITIKKEAAA